MLATRALLRITLLCRRRLGGFFFVLCGDGIFIFLFLFFYFFFAACGWWRCYIEPVGLVLKESLIGEDLYCCRFCLDFQRGEENG